jgi:SAM-dependent methyltransferase
LTRLNLSDNSFDVIICVHHLQHAPDVAGLLAEAARVLKPGGLFLADIQPYAALGGAFWPEAKIPWQHLHPEAGLYTVQNQKLLLNKWREVQFQEAVASYFRIEQWLPEVDAQAQAQLTPEIKAELSDYAEEELTRKQIVVVARKRA